ncbi:translin-associated protein X-like protein [Radiomyces spectabilis]|uniref:translin-associated protein X-like protein n=1 Tax=Radiomyces spectabilis TaxID=64574 RepID=UPI00221FD601|nr:translin-associated protein X-like protein [Radiomyces spectabilis]KAI8369338.1 translin-associated protein X-like protein [Radiomyces spectabilis]
MEAFFMQCRDTLDVHHDKRERIIKLSRDITALSKKLIFALHRTTQNEQASKNGYKDARAKQEEIMRLFKQLAPEVEGASYYRYARSFSGAFEEYIEAIAFFHYLEHQKLILKSEIDKHFVDDDGQPWLKVQQQDYILGLADFTGELMRMAINNVATGKYDQAMNICKLLRALSSDFELLSGTTFPLLNKKMNALRSSLNKVERACYTYRIRGSEYPREIYESMIRDHHARYDEERQSAMAMNDE